MGFTFYSFLLQKRSFEERLWGFTCISKEIFHRKERSRRKAGARCVRREVKRWVGCRLPCCDFVFVCWKINIRSQEVSCRLLCLLYLTVENLINSANKYQKISWVRREAKSCFVLKQKLYFVVNYHTNIQSKANQDYHMIGSWILQT